MDIINICSFAQVIYLVLSAGILFGIYYAFRDKDEFTRTTVLYILSAVNLLQHLFKFVIWPNCFGTGFNLINTAYNVCAFQIIITPFLVKTKRGVLKEFNVYVGGIGCFLAFLYPSWFLGKTIFQWEFLRFWVCHFLLLATSVLPFLWGMVEFDRKNYWKIGLMWLLMLVVILVNDVLCIYMGLYGSPSRLYEALDELNPISIMHPNPSVPILAEIVKWFSPAIFLGQLSGGVYTPILWYMTPIYILLTIVDYGLANLWEMLKKHYYIYSLSGATALRKSKKQIYFERRDRQCKTF